MVATVRTRGGGSVTCGARGKALISERKRRLSMPGSIQRLWSMTNATLWHHPFMPGLTGQAGPASPVPRGLTSAPAAATAAAIAPAAAASAVFNWIDFVHLKTPFHTLRRRGGRSLTVGRHPSCTGVCRMALDRRTRAWPAPVLSAGRAHLAHTCLQCPMGPVEANARVVRRDALLQRKGDW